MHGLYVMEDYYIIMKFSLRVHSLFTSILHLFFESLNPSLKIYIGDFLVFDYLINGEQNSVSRSAVK